MFEKEGVSTHKVVYYSVKWRYEFGLSVVYIVGSPKEKNCNCNKGVTPLHSHYDTMKTHLKMKNITKVKETLFSWLNHSFPLLYNYYTVTDRLR